MESKRDNTEHKLCYIEDNNKYRNYHDVATEWQSPSKEPTTGERGDIMDWQEKYIEKLDQSVQEIKNESKEIRKEIKETKNELKNDFSSKMDQFMSELRDRDNQRHLEILAIQERIDENIRDVKTDISSVKGEMKTTNKWIMGLVIAAGMSFLGIAISLSIGMVNVINIVNTLVNK